MADGNNGNPYRRSSNYRGGHFSSIPGTGGAPASNYFSEDTSNDNPDQHLWDNFETVACSVADLYKNPSWNVFQRTAAAATQFYKDSVDSYRRGTESGMTIGRQVLCKDILHWLQTSNHNSPFIRRDEIINYVLTRAMMTPNISGSESGAGVTTANSVDLDNSSQMQTQQHQDSPSSVSEPLEIFQEALAMPRQHNSASATGLTAFFAEECRRHTSGKRRRLSPEHHPYYFHSSDSPPDGNGNAGHWHGRPSKRQRRL